MNVTTRGRYAVRAMLHIAMAESERPVSVQEIAEVEKISAPYLAQLLSQLAGAGIATSTRGARGGYHLNGEAAEISVGSILDAVDEEIKLTPCTGSDPRCPLHREDRCPARQMWAEAARHLRDYFSQLTLAKVLCGEGAEAMGVYSLQQ